MSQRTSKIVSQPESGVQRLLATLLKTIGVTMPLEQTNLEGILGRIREHCVVMALNEVHWDYALAARLVGINQRKLKNRQWKTRGKRRTGPIPPRPKDQTGFEEE